MSTCSGDSGWGNQGRISREQCGRSREKLGTVGDRAWPDDGCILSVQPPEVGEAISPGDSAAVARSFL